MGEYFACLSKIVRDAMLISEGQLNRVHKDDHSIYSAAVFSLTVYNTSQSSRRVRHVPKRCT